jgi:tetratricopeptide (TPR) repeat protein
MDLLDAGENQRAINDLTRLLKMDPDNVAALLNLGRAQHNMQRSGDALKTFDRVYELDSQTSLIHFHRGVVLYALGRFDETIDVLNVQIASRPDHVRSHYFRGLAHLYKGEWDPALADLKIAVDGMPESSDAVFRLGRCFDHFGRLEEAEAAFRTSSKLDPGDVRPVYALGNLLLKAGRAEEAKLLLDKAVEQYEERITRPAREMQFKSTNQFPID